MKKLIPVVLFTLFAYQNITAQADTLSIYDIYDKSLSELMEIEVYVASKSIESVNDAPGIITVFSEKEIQSFACRTLGDILNRIPGAVTLSANIFVENIVNFRGQELTPYNNHTLILINGRPMRDPISGGLNGPFYTSFPVSIIEKIEVIRGPGSVLFGSCAYSGVINIITKSSDINGYNIVINANAGDRNTFKEEISAVFKKNEFQFNIGLNNYISDGQVFRFTDYLLVDSSANFDRRNIGIYANIIYKGFSINTSYLDFAVFGLAGEDNNWNFPEAHDNNRQKVYWTDIGYSNDINDKLTIDLNLAFHNHSWDHNPEVNMTASSIFFETSLNYNPIEKLNIVTGISSERNTHTGERFIDDIEYSSSIYLQSKYRILKKLILIGGFQYNKPQYVDGRFSPRLGIIANITDNFGVKALYSEAFRNGYPLETSFDLDVFQGNKELDPEIITTSEFQLFLNSEKIQTSLTGYYSLMTDIIIRNYYEDLTLPAGFYLKYGNGGWHEFYGIEYEWKLGIVKNLSTIGSITYQENVNEAGIKNATLHANSTVKIGLLYNNNFFSTGIFNSFFGKPTQVSAINPDVQIVNKVPDAYNLLSAKLSLNLSNIFDMQIKRFSFTFQAQNILDNDIRYPEFTSKGINSLIPLYNGTRYLFGFSLEI